MLLAWPGMGNVAIGSIDYLRRKLDMQPFAEINMEQLFAPDMVIVENGVTILPPFPRSIFYYDQQSQLIVFESEIQLSGQTGVNLLEKILDFAEDMKVKRIYTTAAFPFPVSYREPSKIFGATNKKYLLDLLSNYGIKIMEGGQISGLNGLLLGYAAKRKIEAICLLSTLPFYAINFPNPKSAKAIVEILERILDIKIDMKELNSAIYEMEEKMAIIEEKIKDTFPEIQINGGDLSKEEKVPDYIMEKIKRLFSESEVDKTKAYILKEELDRWNLYNLYEDKFLDLFKKKDNQ